MKTKFIMGICGLGLLIAAATCSFHPVPQEDYARCEPGGNCTNPECTCTATGVCLPPDDADPAFCACAENSDCNDDNPCTADRCQRIGGCSNLPMDDGSNCGPCKMCEAGLCVDDTTGSLDGDGDGHIDSACGGDANDCDDSRADVFPGAFEACDARDNDCDDVVDNLQFAYLQEFEINPNMVPADQLNDFPVLVHVTLPHGQGLLAADFRDLVFLARPDLCTSRMPYEIEHYNPSTQELFAWVRFPTLNTTIDVGHTFYMYWGLAISEDQSRPNHVWSDDVLMVHHMDEMREGFFPDSSGDEHHATPFSSTQPMTPSIIHEGVSFDGENTRLLEIEHDAVFDLNGNLTIEALVKVPGTVLAENPDSGEWQILSHHTDTPHTGYVLLLIRNSSETLLELRTYVDTVDENGNPATKIWNLRQPVSDFMSPGTWHHLVGRKDDAGLHVFVDGHKIGSSSPEHEAVPPSIRYEEDLPVRIGASAYGDATIGHNNFFLFEGDIDEVRVHRVARSDAWIKAQANSLLDPGNFLVCNECVIEE
ncbi:MAG: hypothetical protein JRF33_17425 [Deltaproteobacteria bacterium]|nr:hypothetical protein [Deltaproteobacteria bacterium]